MENIKVSFIVPVYNVEKYLKRSLNSLVKQTLKDIEIICINDGSKDNSRKILEKFAADDKRIIVINQENQGVSIARNQGINRARGEYIAFLDPDDYVEETLCEEVYEVSKKNNTDITVFGGEVFSEEEIADEYLAGAFAFFQDNLNTTSAFYVGNPVDALMKCKGSWPLIWNKFYKRELVIESKGFSERLALGEDEAFVFTVFPMAQRILYLDKKYYHYLRNRPESATDKIVTDFEKRAKYNLEVAREVKENWEKLGIIDEYEQEYLTRYIELLFDSAMSIKFAPDKQKLYLQQVFELLNSFESFSKRMMDAWFHNYYLDSQINNKNIEIQNKQNEIYGLINSKNIAEGQVQVLKEVLIARKNNKLGKNKNRKILTNIKNKFKSKTENFKNISNIFNLIEVNGLNTYEKLKKAYGDDCVFFSCAYAGIGDAYLIGCYINEWLKYKNISNYRFLLGGKSEMKMAEALFPQFKNKCVSITQKEHEWLRNLSRICDYEIDFYFFHHYDYMQPHLQLTDFIQGYNGINMKELYLNQMELPVDTPCINPKVTNRYNEEVDELFKKYNLSEGKTILIAPYSTCLGHLSNEFWNPIVYKLKQKGYKVCCNCNTNEKAIEGTVGIFIEFKYLLQFVEKAGYFIGFRSGLCDVISSCNCDIYVIYPYNSAFWGDGKALDYVGMRNMWLKGNIKELELGRNNFNIKNVQKTLIDNFRNLEDNK